MNNTIDEIKGMLDRLNKELENLRSENRELKERLRKYESVTETEKFETAEQTEPFDKDELYKLGDSLIKHSTDDEVQAITKLMTYWRDNTTASSLPTKVILGVISSQCLSITALEVIYDFIMVGKEQYISILGKKKKMPKKYANMLAALLETEELPYEKVESLLDVYFEQYYSRDITRLRHGRNEALYKSFMSSQKYKVIEDGRFSFYIEKK